MNRPLRRLLGAFWACWEPSPDERELRRHILAERATLLVRKRRADHVLREFQTPAARPDSRRP